MKVRESFWGPNTDSLVRILLSLNYHWTGPAHDNTYNKICVTSKGADEPVRSHSMPRVLVYPCLDSPDAVEGSCDQRRLIIILS